MPLYMDIHRNMVGLTDEAAEAAHQKDLEVQHKHGVRYLSYWYDKEMGKVFCLVEAPSKEAAAAVHREAHGNVADEIFEGKQGEQCRRWQGYPCNVHSVITTPRLTPHFVSSAGAS
jgi:hypothetical protein